MTTSFTAYLISDAPPTPLSVEQMLDAYAPLHLIDRCDRCGAQAFIRATLPGDRLAALTFCNHHGTEYEAGLREIGAEFYRQDIISRVNDTDH